MGDPLSDDLVATAVDRWNATVGERLLRVLVPIYREGPRHPELFGTGVLIDCSEFVCVVTAAHVAEDVRRGSPYYFGAAGELIPIQGMRYTSPLAPGATRDEDRLDLGWWVLPLATAARIPVDDRVRVSELDPTGADAESGSRFFVNGYPANRQPRHFAGDEWKAVAFSFITEEATAAEYSAASVDHHQNILVHFDPSDTFRRGAKATGPHLFGISGGAIWRLGGAGASAYDPKLAAIVISWRRSEPKGIIGVRSHILVGGLVHNLAHIREHAL